MKASAHQIYETALNGTHGITAQPLVKLFFLTRFIRSILTDMCDEYDDEAHIISYYHNVESWNRFFFSNWIYRRSIEHLCCASNAGQYNKIIIYFIGRDHSTTNRHLDSGWNQIKKPHIWWEHRTLIYSPMKLKVNESIEETNITKYVTVNSIQLFSCFETTTIVCYSLFLFWKSISRSENGS